MHFEHCAGVHHKLDPCRQSPQLRHKNEENKMEVALRQFNDNCIAFGCKSHLQLPQLIDQYWSYPWLKGIFDLVNTEE